MNTLKQKMFNYFGNNKTLNYITLICFALIFIFLIWDGVYEVNKLLQQLSDDKSILFFTKITYMYLFQDIIALIFIIGLVGVYLNFPRKIKLFILFFYVGIYIIYEVISKVYSIETKHPLEYSHQSIWTIGCFMVIGLNAILLLFLNKRRKNTLLIIMFMVLNFCINMSDVWQTVYMFKELHDNSLKKIIQFIQNHFHFKIYFVFICIAAVVILLFIPIYKNQCPQCGFKNAKHAKFCGKCGHNLTEKVFNLPFKK